MATAKKAVPAKPVAPAKPAPKSTAVAKIEKKATAVEPSEMSDLFAQHAGEGLERAGLRDFALPFIQVLQKMSPQVDEGDDAYVDGAKAGMFLNTVTNELFDELTVIPCDFHKVYNEWVPRDEGGGFVGSHATQDAADQAKRDDTQIVETANHYVLVETENGWQPAILSLTSTKLKASRNWNSQIAQRTMDTPRGRKMAPSFACKYTVKSIGEENDKGKYYTIGVSPVEGPDGWVNDVELFNQALGFREQLKAGIAKTEFGKTPGDVVEGEDGDGKY